MYLELLYNIAVLIALAASLQALTRSSKMHLPAYRLLCGLLFGLIGLIVMMMPLHFAPGVIYDGRSVVLMLAGLFGGPLPAAIASALCGAYRLYLGGAGVPVGLVSIAASALAGVLLRHLRKRDTRWVRPWRLLAAAFLLHVLIVAFQFALPEGMGIEVLRQVAPVVLVVYPLAFVLAAHFFLEGEQRRLRLRALAESEQRYRSLFENNHAVMLLIEPESGQIVDANPAAERFYGWERDRLRAMQISEINTLPPERIQAEMAAAREEQRRQFHFQHRLADGSVREVEVYSGPIRFAGQHLLYSMVHDITERRKAEEALQRREQHLQTILDTTADGFVVVGIDGRIRHVNGAYCAMSGYSQNALLGMAISDIDVDESPEDTARHIERTMALGTELFEAQHRRKDGSIFPVEVSSTFVDQDGGYFVCFCRDMTERRREETRLAKTQAELRAIYEHAPVMLCVLNEQREVVQANRQFTAFRADAEDRRGHAGGFLGCVGAHHDRCSCGHSPLCEQCSILRAIERTAKTGAVSSGVEKCMAVERDGREQEVWLLASTAMLHGASGGNVLLCMQDISGLKQAEIALRENEALLAAMISCSPVALYSIDPEGVVQNWNASAERIFGWEAGEIIGKPLPFVPEDQQEAFESMRSDVIAGHALIGLEIVRARKDGSMMTGRLSAAPIRDTRGASWGS